MELSTIIPSTTIIAARVTIFSSMPTMYMMATDTNVLSGMVIAATMAERSGKSTIITRMIIIIEIIRSRRKDVMLTDTTLGLSAMRVTLTSSGSSFSRNSSSTRSTSLPYCMTLFPGLISMERSTQGRPFCSIRLAIGSYSRTTRAISFTRTTLPLTGSLKIIWLAISSSLFSTVSTWMGICWSSSLILPLRVVTPCPCNCAKSTC